MSPESEGPVMDLSERWTIEFVRENPGLALLQMRKLAAEIEPYSVVEREAVPPPTRGAVSAEGVRAVVNAQSHMHDSVVAALQAENARQRQELEALRRQLRGAVDPYRAALEYLMEFGKRLMNSDDEGERGIGCCICEGARIVEDGPPAGGRRR
jgi:hypothetical protein